jgi:hypothetical protein
MSRALVREIWLHFSINLETPSKGSMMTKLFFPYSHKDEVLRNELETHLAMLKRDGTITTWNDRRITAGSDLDQEISANLEEANIILLLISANFLASDYCYNKEMQRALQKHADGSAVVIPVILRPCDWLSSPFGNLRGTPTDGKPVTMFGNPDEAFAIVAHDIREVANRFPKVYSTKLFVQEAAENTTNTPGPRSSNLRVKRKFLDHERDEFLEDSYEYIARFFEGSLDELQKRNPHIKARFKRIDNTSFSASVYDEGNRVSECSVFYGGQGHFGSSGIGYSNSVSSHRNSYNDMLTVHDDGYTLYLSSGMFHGGGQQPLTQQGAAEHYWSTLIRPLQI